MKQEETSDHDSVRTVHPASAVIGGALLLTAMALEAGDKSMFMMGGGVVVGICSVYVIDALEIGPLEVFRRG